VAESTDGKGSLFVDVFRFAPVMRGKEWHGKLIFEIDGSN
jgi:hypothetical protein